MSSSTPELPPAWLPLLEEPGPADLGPGPRAGVWPSARVRSTVEGLLGRSPARDRIAALLLLWHDHHDEAHAIVQDMLDRDGSLIHAILHRREPDFGNASYWFHRVPSHPAYALLASRASGVIAAADPASAAQCRALLSRGAWNPMAFVDACEGAADLDADAPLCGLLRSLQAWETRSVLESLLARDSAS
jgi:hypothetical protein